MVGFPFDKESNMNSDSIYRDEFEIRTEISEPEHGKWTGRYQVHKGNEKLADESLTTRFDSRAEAQTNAEQRGIEAMAAIVATKKIVK
jgi:hypothetical protein